MAGKDRYLLSSVSNTLELLNLLGKRDNLGVAEISKLTGFDKASVFRMLYTLEKYDFVEKSEDAKYRLGLKFLYFGSIVTERQNMIEASRPSMKRASQRSNWSFHLSILEGGRVVTIHKEDPANDIQVTVRVGMSFPAYCTAMGRVLLANLEKQAQEEEISKYELHVYSQNSIKTLEELREVLSNIRTLGYATEVDDRFRGFGSIAVPIYNHFGVCVASLGIITPAQEVKLELDLFLSELITTSKEISIALGY